MPAPGPLFAVIAELTAVIGLIAALFGALAKYQEWRNRQKEHAHLDAGGRSLPPTPATGLSLVPAWVFPTVIAGGLFLLCGGCAVTMFKTKPDPGPGPVNQDKKDKDKDKDKGKSSEDKFAGRKVPVNRPIEAWDDRLGITLESVEFRKNNRMRWHLAIANKTGHEVSVPINPSESSLVDQNGRKSNGVEHSAGSHTGVGVVDGETKAYWIDFATPAADATKLVATFPVVAGGNNLSSFGLELVPGPDGPGVSADTLVRRIVIAKPLATWNPQITCTLESVEFRPEGRMRWRYTFWNRSGTASGIYTYPDENTYLTDEKGAKYPGVAHTTTSSIGSDLPDGEKVARWIEFRSPPPDAAWLTARFGSGLDPDRKVPGAVLHLPPGKAGPMASLTFAADAGAAVLDETLDLTIGGGTAKLHVTKQSPRAETTAIVPVGTEVKYAVRATTQVNLNGKEATYSGMGSGSYPVPADRRLVFIRDTAAGFNNFRALFQEPR